MSLTAAMNAAVSGLTASSRGMQTVSDNISNALTEGYAARSVSLESSEFGGVRISGVRRQVDPALLANRRTADAGQSAAQTLSSYNVEMERLVGGVEDAGSIAGRVNRFEADLIAAASTPESDIRLAGVAQSAKDLVRTLRAAADGVSQQRQRADAAIANDVEDLNTGLKRIERLNKQITQTRVAGRDTSALEDQRQVAIDKINEIVPVRELPREYGQVALYAENGAILLDGLPAEIGFTETPGINPMWTYEDGALSGLTINGNPIVPGPDGALGGGRLGALFEIRDELAVESQMFLDSFARDLIQRFEDPGLTGGTTGLFTDTGLAFDPTLETGLANRISVDTQVDPDGAAEVWRLRDGLDAATQGPPGDATRLSLMVDLMQDGRVPSATALSSSLVSSAELASALSSRISSDRVTADRELSLANTAKSELMRIEQEQGVDTDAELQNLIAIEQAYSANARVLTAVDEMLQTLLGI